jgi:hypothetical protein
MLGSMDPQQVPAPRDKGNGHTGARRRGKRTSEEIMNTCNVNLKHGALHRGFSQLFSEVVHWLGRDPKSQTQSD